MTIEKVKAADEEPVYFIYPYARILLLKYYARFRETYNSNSIESFVKLEFRKEKSDLPQNLGTLTSQLRFEVGCLISMERETARICHTLPQSLARSQFEDLLRDISSLKSDYLKSAADYRQLKQDSLVNEQLEEARESKDVAVSVGRLSKLAFVFIPLSFTTSVFGMNITEFGQGTASLKIFFITAVAINILTLIPVLKPLWTGIRETSFGRFLQDLGLAIRLARYSPSLGFWYAALRVFCSHPVLERLCGYNVRRALDGSATHDRGNIRIEEAHSRLREVLFSAFWSAKIQMINTYLEQPDWSHSTFFGRVVANWSWRRRTVDAEGDSGSEVNI